MFFSSGTLVPPLWRCQATEEVGEAASVSLDALAAAMGQDERVPELTVTSTTRLRWAFIRCSHASVRACSSARLRGGSCVWK